ncbi:hypothetical protein FVEN_g843 [Fusarium venenatum]|uniref:uncharacterized protein n=1 Tax=Fusarium venenatum TaxID=56646 RepID=UPI001DA236A6|nr:hypothetical protein FVEN_g843 [Fusarium venenatum]KAH6967326.1 hypothetical protein EDB82DRAFT_531011 [Fusarium venenatum]
MPRSRRPSRALRLDVSDLSGTTIVSDGSSSGPSTPPSRISPSRIIDDGSPPNRSPSSGPSTAFSRISPSWIIDDGHPPSYRSSSSPNYPSTAIGGGPAESSQGTWWAPTSVVAPLTKPTYCPSGRAPSHRAFTPATVAPSVYLGQGGRNPTTTVRPRDSASQIPTVVLRYPTQHRRDHGGHRRHESSSVVRIMPEGHECPPIIFPRVTDREHALQIWAELDDKTDDLEREYGNARRAIERTMGSSEFPRALAENVITSLYRFIKAQLERDTYYLYHRSLIGADLQPLYRERYAEDQN